MMTHKMAPMNCHTHYTEGRMFKLVEIWNLRDFFTVEKKYKFSGKMANLNQEPTSFSTRPAHPVPLALAQL